jgi:transposase
MVVPVVLTVTRGFRFRFNDDYNEEIKHACVILRKNASFYMARNRCPWRDLVALKTTYITWTRAGSESQESAGKMGWESLIYPRSQIFSPGIFPRRSHIDPRGPGAGLGHSSHRTKNQQFQPSWGTTTKHVLFSVFYYLSSF